MVTVGNFDIGVTTPTPGLGVSHQESPLITYHRSAPRPDFRTSGTSEWRSFELWSTVQPAEDRGATCASYAYL